MNIAEEEGVKLDTELKQVWNDFAYKQLLKGMKAHAQLLLGSMPGAELDVLESAHENLSAEFDNRQSLVSHFKIICFFMLGRYSLVIDEAKSFFNSPWAFDSPEVWRLTSIYKGLAQYMSFLKAENNIEDLLSASKSLEKGFAELHSEFETDFLRECLGGLYPKALYVLAKSKFTLATFEDEQNEQLSLFLSSLNCLNQAIQSFEREASEENQIVFFLHPWIVRAYALRAKILLDCMGSGECMKALNDLQVSERLHSQIYLRAKRFPFEALKNRAKSAREEHMKKCKKQRREISKSGFVYLLAYKGSSGERMYKIGRSKNPTRRSHYLSSSAPKPSELLHVIRCNDMCRVENYFHVKFRPKRINGEWFNLNDEDIGFIKSFANITDIPRELIKSKRVEANEYDELLAG